MKSLSTLELLRRYESRNVTFVEPDGSWPIVWKRARGVHVWDEQGKKYLDLTAAFGVAAAGHANPRVVAAGRRQMGQLLHAMGDVHPHRPKAELAQALSRLTFERWTSPSRGRTTGKTIFCNSGFEAVEAALKTSLLATGKPGVIAFEQAYHGLGYGALNITHREHFRSPFRRQLRQFGHFVPFPTAPFTPSRSDSAARVLDAVETRVRRRLRTGTIGAILVEPVQARGGINVPPAQFLPLLRRLCSEHGALLILDEIYTGFGRTGHWFACEHSRVVPDLICVGKALTGGFPLSACVGGAELMDAAWPNSNGEAIHTSTFLGHPVGCAMALANLRELSNQRLPERSGRVGAVLLKDLQRLADRTNGSPKVRLVARGLGLLTGLEVLQADGTPATTLALSTIKTLLHRGFILLPEGEHANVISFTPPLTISTTALRIALNALEDVLFEQL
jgi:4-aminobutyrate aminotransferase-like enzyme